MLNTSAREGAGTSDDPQHHQAVAAAAAPNAQHPMSAHVVFIVLAAWLAIDAAIVATIAILSTRGRRARAAAIGPSAPARSGSPGSAEPLTGAGHGRSRSNHETRNLS